jgi:hypothetical protein
MSDSATASVWDRLRPTGEYAALLYDGNLVGGIVMRPDKKHRSWAYENDQDVDSFAYIDAVSAASREASTFDIRLARTVDASPAGLAWALFRFPSGDVKAAWLPSGPPVRASIDGTRLASGVLYPQEYVVAPIRLKVLVGDLGLGAPRVEQALPADDGSGTQTSQ